MAAALERDAGFCSAEEDFAEPEDGDVQSPTDASEDSVEVRVRPVSAKGRRKCAEPRRRGDDDDVGDGPPAKRRPADHGPFRPWSYGTQEEPLSLVLREKAPEAASQSPPPRPREVVRPSPSATVVRTPPAVRPDVIARVPPIFSVKSEFPEAAIRAPSGPDERFLRIAPIAAVKSEYAEASLGAPGPSALPDYYERLPGPHRVLARAREFEEVLRRPGSATPVKLEEIDRYPRAPSEPDRAGPPSRALDEPSFSSRNAEADRVRPEPGERAGPSRPPPASAPSPQHGQQRNYKNMTRERRIEANARERTRVHTISAAFDTLRRAVPAYSHNQKLSKLSVLRIACSYILTLSRVAGADYSADQSRPDLSDCVENVSRTIQMEGKLRKKRDE